VLLLILALAIVFIRIHVYDQPYERDVTTYSLIGHALNSGKQLYIQVWDHKPPAIYWTYAVADCFAGHGPMSVFLLGLIPALATLMLVFLAGKGPDQNTAGTQSRDAIRVLIAGAVAGIVWTLSGNDLSMAATEPNTEVFINLLVAAGFVLAIKASSGLGSWRRALSIGFLFGIASLYKPVCLSVLAAMSVVSFLPAEGAPDKRSLLKTFVEVTTAWLAVCVSWLSVFLYFCAIGARKPFIGAVFTYNKFYAGNLTQNLLKAFEPNILVHQTLQYCLPLFAVCILAVVAGLFSRQRRNWTMLLAYFAGTAGAVLVPGQYFEHYYQLYLPPLAIGAGWSIHLLSQRLPVRFSWLAPVCGLLLVAMLFAHEIPALAGSGPAWQAKYFGDQAIETKQLGTRLKFLLKQGDTFYEWGSETGLYFYSDGSPVTTVLFHKHMVDGPFVQQFEATTIEELKRAQPKLVILCSDYLKPGWQNDPVLKWCMENYMPITNGPKYRHFLLYANKRQRA
jgi:hypothetical protein